MTNDALNGRIGTCLVICTLCVTLIRELSIINEVWGWKRMESQ